VVKKLNLKRGHLVHKHNLTNGLGKMEFVETSMTNFRRFSVFLNVYIIMRRDELIII